MKDERCRTSLTTSRNPSMITTLICFPYILTPLWFCFQRFPDAWHLFRTSVQPIVFSSIFPSLIEILLCLAQKVFSTMNTSFTLLSFLLSDFAHCAQLLMWRGAALAISSVFPISVQISVIKPIYLIIPRFFRTQSDFHIQRLRFLYTSVAL